MSKTKDLTQGHPSKILLMFSLPIFMGNILLGCADSDMLFYRTVYAECHKGVAADI